MKNRLIRFLVCAGFCLVALHLSAETALPVKVEPHLDALTIGTHTYSNVTVTTQNKDYIFFHHSQGMMNVKVSQLPVEVRQFLGYEAPPKPAAPSAATVWAKEKLTKLEQPEVKLVQQRLEQRARALRCVSMASHSSGDSNV
jgi:hypothetical protein